MKVTIKCFECAEVMGHLEKPVVTDEDVALYQAQTVCSNGHVMKAELVEEDEE